MAVRFAAMRFGGETAQIVCSGLPRHAGAVRDRVVVLAGARGSCGERKDLDGVAQDDLFTDALGDFVGVELRWFRRDVRRW